VRRRIIGAEGGDEPGRTQFSPAVKSTRRDRETGQAKSPDCPSVKQADVPRRCYSKRIRRSGAKRRMRGQGADRKRMVEACGGTEKKIRRRRSGKHSASSLSQQRTRADRRRADTAPAFGAHNDENAPDRQERIDDLHARPHPKWDDGRASWRRWWAQPRGAFRPEK